MYVIDEYLRSENGNADLSTISSKETLNGVPKDDEGNILALAVKPKDLIRICNARAGPSIAK
jgi:hypothetical protein